MAALQQPGELLGRLLASGHELLPRLQPGGQVLPLLHQSGQAGLLRLLGLPGLLGLPADLPGPPQLLLALGELRGLLGQCHRLPPQGGGLLPLPLGGLVGLLRLLVSLPGGGQGPGRRSLPLGETFDGGEVLMGSTGDGFLWVEPGDLGLVRAGNKKED